MLHVFLLVIVGCVALWAVMLTRRFLLSPREPRAPRPSLTARQDAAFWNHVLDSMPPAAPDPPYETTLGPYLLAQCDFLADMTELAARYRDAGGAHDQFLARMEPVMADKAPAVAEDKRNIIGAAALSAYSVPGAPPHELRELARRVGL